MHNLYLCGFMGTGKTTIGRELARRMKVPYLDTDQMIEERAGKPITQIFAEEGEAYFRALEREILTETGKIPHAVVSTGGGCLCTEENVAIAKAQGLILFLQTPFATCYKRIKDKGTRPLVLQKTKEELEELFQKREIIYRGCADLVIPGPDLVRHIVQDILQKLSAHPDYQPKEEQA